MLYETIKSTLQEEHLLTPDQAVLVAFSGGSDSLCLLDCLRELGYELHAAHLDHQLRASSGEEAEAARALANQMGVACTVGRETIESEGSSLEHSARRARYQFLCRVAHEEGLKAIATGHTADDQAETVLMHLLRGTGSAGLRGMPAKSDLGDRYDLPEGSGLTLIRPLLRATKEQTEKHCAEAGLRPIDDPSNSDQRFFRNRLRHHLLPILEGYNRNIKGALVRLAHIATAESDFIQAAADTAMNETISVKADAVRIDLELFRSLPLAIQRLLIRRAVEKVDPAQRDLSFEQTRAALHFILYTMHDALTLPGGLEMLRVAKQIFLRQAQAPLSFPDYPQLPETNPLAVPLSGELNLANGWKLRTETLQAGDGLIDRTQSDDRAAFDLEQIDGLSMSSLQAGDRIQLLGMQGSSKVSDVLINLKIPQHARIRWPILRDEQGILWVVGLRMSGVYRIRPDTKDALLVKLIRPDSEHGKLDRFGPIYDPQPTGTE